ncbi:MAG: hypothetical protein AB7P21_17425 [Lautropia sp.]
MRDVRWDEIAGLEDKGLQQWLQVERFDDLMEHALPEFDIADGAQIALASLYDGYWQTSNEEGKAHVESGMLRVQSAARPTRRPGKRGPTLVDGRSTRKQEAFDRDGDARNAHQQPASDRFAGNDTELLLKSNGRHLNRHTERHSHARRNSAIQQCTGTGRPEDV